MNGEGLFFFKDIRLNSCAKSPLSINTIIIFLLEWILSYLVVNMGMVDNINP